MNCTFHTNTQGRLTARVLRLNRKTALVQIMERCPSMIRPNAWRLTSQILCIHKTKSDLKLYPDYIIPGKGY